MQISRMSPNGIKCSTLKPKGKEIKEDYLKPVADDLRQSPLATHRVLIQVRRGPWTGNVEENSLDALSFVSLKFRVCSSEYRLTALPSVSILRSSEVCYPRRTDLTENKSWSSVFGMHSRGPFHWQQSLFPTIFSNKDPLHKHTLLTSVSLNRSYSAMQER